jgi:hypothetical protein
VIHSGARVNDSSAPVANAHLVACDLLEDNEEQEQRADGDLGIPPRDVQSPRSFTGAF